MQGRFSDKKRIKGQSTQMGYCSVLGKGKCSAIKFDYLITVRQVHSMSIKTEMSIL